MELTSINTHTGCCEVFIKHYTSKLTLGIFILVFTVILICIILIVIKVHFPRMKLQEEEKSGSFESYKILLHNKYVYLFFLGILAYVATEQGIANWISKFLEQYHGLNPQTEGAA